MKRYQIVIDMESEPEIGVDAAQAIGDALRVLHIVDKLGDRLTIRSKCNSVIARELSADGVYLTRSDAVVVEFRREVVTR